MKKILFYLLSKIEFFTGYFVSISLHPIKFESYPSVDRIQDNDGSKVAIVVQGPVIIKNDFTFETLKLYVNIFPNEIIVLSTWDCNKNVEVFAKIRNLGVHVVLNKYPEYAGIGNVNYQIFSTISGVVEAELLGATHCIKTRTDQRIYRNTSVNLLMSILNSFALSDNSKNQNQRILSVDYSTSTRELYWLGDVFMFGNIYDIKKSWSVGLQSDKADVYLDDDFNKCMNSDGLIPEMYLTVSYLKSIGCDLKWSKCDWWNVIKDRFCVVDKDMIDLYWQKYDSRFRSNSLQDYSCLDSDSRINFARWITEYTSKK